MPDEGQDAVDKKAPSNNDGDYDKQGQLEHCDNQINCPPDHGKPTKNYTQEYSQTYESIIHSKILALTESLYSKIGFGATAALQRTAILQSR
jgi:hypothetical protein